MLSYRHAFHAGNHGDVLKHTILAKTLDYLIQKDRPFMYVDTHAGAGQYDLNHNVANKINDKATGVEKIWHEKVLPSLLQPYFNVLRKYNFNQKLHLYPGSSLIAQYFMRSHDRAVCYELHPNDYRKLVKTFIVDRRFQILQKDGFKELCSHLPPKERRGLILIDPSYEQIAEYKSVLISIKKAMRLFPTAIYIIWYPLLSNQCAMPLLRQLTALSIPKTLRIELNVTDSNSGIGLLGSGLWIINPPWVLEEELKEGLPWLTQKLTVKIYGSILS